MWSNHYGMDVPEDQYEVKKFKRNRTRPINSSPDSQSNMMISLSLYAQPFGEKENKMIIYPRGETLRILLTKFLVSKAIQNDTNRF